MSAWHPLDVEFSRIRADLGLPGEFPDQVLEAADVRAGRVPLPRDERARRADYSFIPFVTIDPEGSRDLDQAVFVQGRGDGFIVLYAIADVGYFVERGGPVEAEAWRRGLTFYGPDARTPLYPPALGAGAASLLPGAERPCVLFSFFVEPDGAHRLVGVERAVIVSRAQLDYERVGRHLDAERGAPGSGELAGEEWSETLGLLERVGRLRTRLEQARGAVSLPIAAQHVSKWAAALHGYRLSLRNPEDVEGWNAQISLMTGMAAAELMIGHGIGLLRTLDPPRFDRLEALRLTAAALEIAWPREWGYAEFIHSLDPTLPLDAAVIYHAAGVMGGARYLSFEGSLPPGSRHAAIASHYAHVTAPLRRLADRYALDLLVELAAGRTPGGDVGAALAHLPPVMENAERLSRNLENAIVNLAEARLLADRVGQQFEALVIRLRDDRVTVQLADPPVRAEVPISAFPADAADGPVSFSDSGAILSSGGYKILLGQAVRLRLTAADPSRGTLRFQPV